jgi:hypothetical protein
MAVGQNIFFALWATPRGQSGWLWISAADKQLSLVYRLHNVLLKCSPLAPIVEACNRNLGTEKPALIRHVLLLRQCPCR